MRILELSDQGVGEKPAVADREKQFASLCGDFFSMPPAQPDELANYGFGLIDADVAVLPYCVSTHSRPVIESLMNDPKIADLIAKIDPYPILAGSAVFLGVDHVLCDDVDLVRYCVVGTSSAERLALAQDLRRLVEALSPNSFTVSYNNRDGAKPEGQRSVEGKTKIRALLDQLIGSDPKNPNPEKVPSLGWAQLAWSAKSNGLNKPITLQLHFVHQSFADKDVHPYQEFHSCAVEDFVHTNKPWLAPSFHHYFSFLSRAITVQLVNENVFKAAKRSAVFLGLIGNSVAQKELISLLDGYSVLDDDGKQQSRLRMEIMIGELRTEVAGAFEHTETR